ncbi:hypothetical protein B0E45_06105 [Sinorhizobium sp. A49]|nr:hypothetical protein B0E45_06105 [Sinorhizobium sp. A49]
MFFIRIGNVVAWVALIFGALRVAIGVFVASADDPETRARMAARYLGSSTSGEAIDQGILVMVFAIAFGILVKIARSLSKR